jgi:hypothetical protein
MPLTKPRAAVLKKLAAFSGEMRSSMRCLRTSGISFAGKSQELSHANPKALREHAVARVKLIAVEDV